MDVGQAHHHLPYHLPDPVTGQVYYGRGYVQLTWAENYKKMGQAIGMGDRLYRNPDLVLDPEIAAKILFVGMIKGKFRYSRRTPPRGWQKLSMFFNRQTENWYRARNIINGDLRRNGSRIAGYGRKYLKAIHLVHATSTPPVASDSGQPATSQPSTTPAPEPTAPAPGPVSEGAADNIPDEGEVVPTLPGAVETPQAEENPSGHPAPQGPQEESASGATAPVGEQPTTPATSGETSVSENPASESSVSEPPIDEITPALPDSGEVVNEQETPQPPSTDAGVAGEDDGAGHDVVPISDGPAPADVVATPTEAPAPTETPSASSVSEGAGDTHSAPSPSGEGNMADTSTTDSNGTDTGTADANMPDTSVTGPAAEGEGAGPAGNADDSATKTDEMMSGTSATDTPRTDTPKADTPQTTPSQPDEKAGEGEKKKGWWASIKAFFAKYRRYIWKWKD